MPVTSFVQWCLCVIVRERVAMSESVAMPEKSVSPHKSTARRRVWRPLLVMVVIFSTCGLGFYGISHTMFCIGPFYHLPQPPAVFHAGNMLIAQAAPSTIPSSSIAIAPLTAVDAQDGHVIWQQPVDGPINITDMQTSDDILYYTMNLLRPQDPQQ